MNRIFILVTAAAAMPIFALPCTHGDIPPSQSLPQIPSITVEEAREFFENSVLHRPSCADAKFKMPFAIGEATLCWERAEASAAYLLSTVDVPLEGMTDYIIDRWDESYNMYYVYAVSKIIVVQSAKSGEREAYVRVSIPDKDYSGTNLCDNTLNCNPRGDYCGLEYYTTIDGFPVAVARFDDGEMTSGVFLYDETLPVAERRARFTSLMSNMWFIPCDNETLKIRNDDNWHYVNHGEAFLNYDGIWCLCCKFPSGEKTISINGLDVGTKYTKERMLSSLGSQPDKIEGPTFDVYSNDYNIYYGEDCFFWIEGDFYGFQLVTSRFALNNHIRVGDNVAKIDDLGGIQELIYDTWSDGKLYPRIINWRPSYESLFGITYVTFHIDENDIITLISSFIHDI